MHLKKGSPIEVAILQKRSKMLITACGLLMLIRCCGREKNCMPSNRASA